MVDVTENEISLTLKRQIDDSYGILIGENLFPQLLDYIKEKFQSSRVAIITDSNVKKVYADELGKFFNKSGLYSNIFSIPAGENNKTNKECNKIQENMAILKYGRDSLVIALGGGMVGDMAGYIAATYCRGIPFIQYPTTLLAQTDASIGGKTGLDLKAGKNLVGAFYQPKRVFIDLATLETLPFEEFRNGLSETIKHGVIRDRFFFNFLENNIDSILKKDKLLLKVIAKENCRIKGGVVEIDPEEKGLRAILNYGHTIGHSIEKLSNYELSHGNCISRGMMVEGRISNKLGYLSNSELARQRRLLERVGLPITIPESINNEDIIKLTSIDKKAISGNARYCLPSSIGEMNPFEGSYTTPVEKDIVLSALQESR